MDATRIESGHLKLDLKSCNLADIVRDTVLLYANSTKKHNIRMNLSSEPLMIMGDSERLGQVLNNLLSNAIKYSPGGGDIWIRGKKEKGNVYLEIQDSGIGIAECELKSIFEPFERSKSSKKMIPGVGLGLSVARKIILAHESGDIYVRSQIGLGSTFVFRLKSLDILSKQDSGLAYLN